ncbi:MAG: NAD-dependent epimerase/dehydratase family protein [Chlorobiaceae bacterium]|nr:NAD-dependent epimerase/dehydratase family protein [Chlorobiaceae bacterium]
MERSVLVTGASGFIGSHLVERCLREGWRVRALVRKGNPRIGTLRRQGVEVTEGDVRDDRAVDAAVRGCGVVFHAAALTSDWGPKRDFMEINVGGTKRICDAALRHGVERLVHVSSFECFPHYRLDRIDETTPYAPRGASYADTKIGSTVEAWSAARKGLGVSVLHPVWVYGPGDRTLVPLLADMIRRGQMLYWSRNARMSLVYIDNLVDLCMLAATHPSAAGEAYLACDMENMTFEGFCNRIASAIGAKQPSLYLPYGLVYSLAGVMETVFRLLRSRKRPMVTRQAVELLASKAFIDASKARRTLGWQSGVSQEEGIRRTLEWLKGVDPREWKVK